MEMGWARVPLRRSRSSYVYKFDGSKNIELNKSEDWDKSKCKNPTLTRKNELKVGHPRLALDGT